MGRKTPTDVDVEITGFSTGGMGVSSINDRPLSVRNALPGERVRARILRKKKGVRFAEGLEVLDTPHTNRRTPACDYFPRCGGCSLQHIEYAHQLSHKQTELNHALDRMDVVPQRWKQATSLQSHGYRRKARLGVRIVGGEVLVGFRESFSSRVARIDDCRMLAPQLACLIRPLKVCLAGLSAPHRIPQLELAMGDDGCVVILRHLDPLTRDDVSVLNRFASAQQVVLLSQAGGYETVCPVAGGNEVPLLHYSLLKGGLTMAFDPREFTQVNAEMNQSLVDNVLEYLQPVEGLRILDLFCGIGNFSLPLVQGGAQVIGVEFAASAVDRARANACANGLDEVEFVAGDLYREADFMATLGRVDALVLDPPRSGAGPLLRRWLELLHPTLAQIVYISCNPVSFAEDAHTMEQAGYRLVEVGAYDMFPQTAHVETIGYFCRS